MARQIKRLYRSSRNSMLGGVCGGLAEYLDIDPNLVRVIYVIVSVASAAFPGILVYIVAWLVIPRDF
ncbi:PspC domain-containing protein [Desulfoscipio gibsoniae]|uniref:Putative stress-responsive transcriptional regulator n=1 Tax=Desulfoscipio gibsoniae DSM 7213 TaxID=767817 RepID=R4KHL0_9FIRM|nr:PspC domain-containing protein [Desulfoscipio gibsoniae]AGL02703.1 putative stress-responsive transcriptional regulator [Desulfoscipio gibsoniae DSM 7213]